MRTVLASQLRPLKGLSDNFSDERGPKTNADLSAFTSFIHLVNAASTMRTKVACKAMTKKVKASSETLIREHLQPGTAQLSGESQCHRKRNQNKCIYIWKRERMRRSPDPIQQTCNAPWQFWPHNQVTHFLIPIGWKIRKSSEKQKPRPK